jgi:hypothetical protein
MAVPLLKCFVLVDKPFWEDDRPANRYAHTIPTREVHYWKTRDKKTGLVMMYTDRPGTEFWSNYLQDLPTACVAPGNGEQTLSVAIRRQDSASIFAWREMQDQGEWKRQKFDNERLLRTFFLYVRENHAESVPDAQILAAAIRDWGLKPAYGATHAWRSGSDWKAILGYLQAFSTMPDEAHGVLRFHVCSEAYSDYHGFIEGALRSARDMLAREPFRLTDETEFRDTAKDRELCRVRVSPED